MSVNLSKRTLVLVAPEPAGTEISQLHPASNTMLLFNEVNIVSVDTRIVPLNPVRQGFTKFKNLVGRQLVMLKPQLVLQGSGTGGTAPYFSPILKACGLNETSGYVSSSSYTRYAPVSDGIISCTSWVYNHDILHKVGNIFGTAVIEGRGGEGLMLTTDLRGNYTTPANSGTTMPTAAQITYPTDRKQLIASEAVSIGGTSTFVIRSIRLDLATSIIERADWNSPVGFKGNYMVDRAPRLSVVLEAENNLATKNWFTDLNAATTHDITFQHGSTAGNIMTCTLDDCALEKVDYQDDGGIRTFALEYNVSNATDDADIDIRFK